VTIFEIHHSSAERMDHTQQDTRTRILQEAERLFRHYGYGKTTIADIAHACGMSSANVYRFFPSKSALMEAICGRLIGDFETRLHAIVGMSAPASERLPLIFEALYQHTTENLLDHHKVHEMVVVAMEEQWLAIRAHIDRVTGLIERIIADGVASGEFAPTDVARTAKCVHTAVMCFCHPVIVAQKMDDETRPRPDEMAALLLMALRRR
jgi:AcrR family transcriptional regulator